MRRPMVYSACAFALGIIFEYVVEIHIGMVIAIGSTTVFSYVLCRKKILPIFLVFLFLGSGSMYFFNISTEPIENLDGVQSELVGTIVCVRTESEKSNLEVETKKGGRLLLTIYGKVDDLKLEDGRNIKINCLLEKPKPSTNPACFNYRLYLKTRGVTMVASVEPLNVAVGQVSKPLKNKLYLIRQNFLNELGKKLDENAKGIITAMLFGDKSGIDEETYESFQQNGTAHILAVSGLHVGMIYALFSGLIGGKRKWGTNIVILTLLFIYAALAGFSPSVIRAVIMISLHVFSKLLHYRYDLLSAVSFTALIMLVINPWNLFGLGFQMSFLAVTSLAILMPLFKNIKINQLVRNTILPVCLIQLGMAPFSAYIFNYFSLGAFLANIPVVFLAGIIVPTGIIAFVISMILPGVMPIFTLFLNFACKGLLICNNIFYAKGITSFQIPSAPLLIVLLYYGFFFYFSCEMSRIWFLRKQWKKYALGILAVIILAGFFSFNFGNSFRSAKLVFVDVGQGSAMHLRTPDGRNILIDGGGKQNYNVGKKILKPYLLKNGVGKIDLALATHKDMDHYKGLCELKEEGMIDQLVTNDSGFKEGSIIYKEKGFLITAVGPVTDSEDENEKCMVLKVEYEDFSMLATGDISKETEKSLISFYENSEMLKTNILAVPHHGSKYSSSSEFIEAVAPRLAIIQVGKNNYGHPALDTLAIYKKYGVAIMRNDEKGAIGVFDGLRVKTVM